MNQMTTIKELIESTPDIQSIYDAVKTYDDLLQTNISFLQHQLPMTFYHAGPVYDVDFSNLITLTTKYRWFTTNGQSNECSEFSEQKPYLSSLVEKSQLDKLLPFLKGPLAEKGFLFNITYYKNGNLIQKEVDIIHSHQLGKMGNDDDENVTNISNYPENKMNITRDKVSGGEWDNVTNDWKGNNIEIFMICWSGFYKLPIYITRWLINNCFSITIIGKSYGVGEIEKELLDFYK